MQPSEALQLQRRHAALQAILLYTLPAASAFIAVHLYLGTFHLAALTAALFIAAVGLLLAMRREVLVEYLAPTYLIVLFSNLITVQVSDAHPGAAVWVPVIPVLCYMLLDARLAAKFCAGSLIAAICAHVLGENGPPQASNLVPAAHLAAASLGLFVLCHFYTRDRIRTDTNLVERSRRDPLTNLWNRVELSDAFARERSRAQRTQLPLSLILVDLDHFKRINDRHGHDAGDAALVFFADLLRERLRQTDLPFRIGGEEFVILLPGTDVAGAQTVAETLRQTLEESPFPYGETSIPITLSGGVVELGRQGKNWPQLYQAADALLFESKEHGRNRISIPRAQGPRPAPTGS